MDTLRSVEQELQSLSTLEIQESRWGTLRETMGLSFCSFESPCVMVQHLDASNFILKKALGLPMVAHGSQEPLPPPGSMTS